MLFHMFHFLCILIFLFSQYFLDCLVTIQNILWKTDVVNRAKYLCRRVPEEQENIEEERYICMGEKNKILARYILPSAGGLCVTYLYNIVDVIFVGRGVGALALAAVNITVPFITTLVAISTLFAMGSSTVIAIRLGRGDKRGANDAFMTALVLTFLLSVLLLIANIF